MKLITWNVQWCRGTDGRVDPERVAASARGLGDFDVLCLQEVAIGFSGLGGSSGEDQMAVLSAALTGWRGHFAPATDLDDGRGGRRQFGNAIFTRLPVLQVFRHALPWPADPSVPSMARVALELVVQGSFGPVRVVSTHLEYYSATVRAAQIEALRRLHQEACAHARAPRPSGDPGEPFDAVPRPRSALICGDFNCTPDGPEHARMTAPFGGDPTPFIDAWEVLHPDLRHPPTVGVHMDNLPRATFDFVFATEDLAPRLQSIAIDGKAQASDHQPIVLDLED
ncbi:MAG: endonuclease/exonuclease/phosphatase family protein [Burkholderiales bacterium]|nr:endonuclease/exonuclease/phosphatase family protein [Burkholderiales bacterium]